MNLSKFTYDQRTGIIAETETGEAVGTELNGAMVTNIDGFLVTNAEIAWRVYHGPIERHQRVIPILAGGTLNINNLKVVDADDETANSEFPGYMSVEQSVLSVSDAPEEAEVSLEEAVQPNEKKSKRRKRSKRQ